MSKFAMLCQRGIQTRTTSKNNTALLRVAHKRINDYTEDLVPGLHDIIGTGVVNQDLVSKFPYDQRSLLSDPYFESRLATYLIRLEFVSGQAKNLLQDQAELVSLINAVTSR